MKSQVYIIKNHKFTKFFPEWDLLKVGSSSNPESRISEVLNGLNKSDYEFEVLNTVFDENTIRLREGKGKTDVHISAFQRIVGCGRTYRPNLTIKAMDERMYEYLKKITDIKTELKQNWGVSEWILRPNLEWIKEQEKIENGRGDINSVVQYISINWQNFYGYAKLLLRRYFLNLKNKL